MDVAVPDGSIGWSVELCHRLIDDALRHLERERSAAHLEVLYVFMIAWNEFLFAFLFMVTNQDNWTLALGLQHLNTIEVPATALMAGSVLISLPVIILFFAAERFLTEGLTAGGVKG